MARTAFQGCFLVILYLIGKTMCICEGPYLNLCGYYENELNATEDAETICDCEQVRFCYLVDLSQECDSTIVKLNTDGNFTLSNLQCDILPLESGVRIPMYEVLNQTESEIILNIVTDNFGRYRVSCSVSEILEESSNTVNNELEIGSVDSTEVTNVDLTEVTNVDPTEVTRVDPTKVTSANPTEITNVDPTKVTTVNPTEVTNVDPTEVTIDSEIMLQLTVVKQTNRPHLWCFIKTPDNTTEVYSSFWVSDTQINCLNFKPVIPGIFQVSLNSIITSNIFDKSINVRVLSKNPIAHKAEYSLDFESIFIYFDENIELHSKCTKMFSKEGLKSFGRDFDCFIRGNVLVVKMGISYHIVDHVSIISENNICRAGSSAEFCLSAPSVSLTVSKPKVLGPSLSLYINPNCDTSQKYINIKLNSPKLSSYSTQNQTLASGKTAGKTQRKNLIMWRTMRKIQSKFSSPLILPQTNTTEVLSLLENLSDDLDVGQNSMGSASVSVYVQSSPGGSSIVAEANITFCEESVKLYQYRWIVNKEDVLESGKVLVVENLAPGKYVVKCQVVGCDLGEILGQGWTTTEILPTAQKVLITPSEITTGETDNISLHAITQPGTSISWTCKKVHGENCITTTGKLASDVLDMTSPNISIPGRTLPVGEYIWSVENAEGNIAKVFIKPGNRATVDVEVPAFMSPSKGVVLRGSVKKAQHDCRIWWSSVREKGFSYLNLNNMGEISIAEGSQIFEMNLVIPPSGDRKGVELDSTYMFKLQVFCPESANNPNGSLDYIKVPLTVYNPPHVSPLTVEPSEGFAMITNFSVTGGQTDVSESMVFEWSYVDSCKEETPIKRGVFGRNFTTFLPPGDMKLQLKVCNERGFCSTTSTPNVSVIQESEFPAENFKKARNQIELLLSSGDTLEAFGVAITAFKSLALIHESESREMIFSTVREGIRTNIKKLTRQLESDRKAAKLCLEFFKQAVTVAKYFRKGSDIMVLLTKFRDRTLRVLGSKKVRRSY